MSTIFVTRPILDEGIQQLKKAGHKVIVPKEDKPISRRDLLEGVKDADALLSLLTDTIDEEVFAAAPHLKVVANYAVGFDNVDLEAAKEHNVIVTNTPAPEVAEAVAEHTFALILALAHRVVESDAYARAKKYKGWSPNALLGTDVRGKTLGVIGLGRIGQSVVDRAVNGFKMKCVYTDRKRDREFEGRYGATYLPQDRLLQVADFVSLHVPLLPTTRHLLSTAEFSLMKKTAFVINTARGPIVDEKALLRALKAKRIAGAALDVYECEPAIDCDLTDKLELKSFPNVVMTPHTASATIEARQAMGRVAAQNILVVLTGKPPINPAG